MLAFGTWQVQRLYWKLDLIATAERNLAQPAVPLPAELEPVASLDYQRFEVSGTFVAEQAMAVGVAARNGELGAALTVPMRLGDGRMLLVDLGWLAESRFSQQAAIDLVPPGQVSLTGIARPYGDQSPGFFNPAPRPEVGRWYGVDLPAMASHLGQPLLPVLLVQDGPPLVAGGAAPAPVAITYRNSHLGYAITWYGLAAALVGVYVAFGRKKGSEACA